MCSEAYYAWYVEINFVIKWSITIGKVECSRHANKGGLSRLLAPQVEILVHRTLVEP